MSFNLRKMLNLTAPRVRAFMIRSQHSASYQESFPSIKVSADSVSAQGSFAEVQAKFLQPDPVNVSALSTLAAQKNMGIVAHFYMDPELQGVLSALDWPHVTIADSLAMGEAATRMAKKGAKAIACLGVDFMSENVRANLDANGFHHVPVFRLSEKKIGCTLAESAEGPQYAAFLEKASKTKKSLHVVYINTSLRTKGYAQDKLPTITCTSSNVVYTVLQAFSQVPDLTVWYGPDTYMGANLQQLFTRLSQMPDSVIQSIHPAHNASTVGALLSRFHFFQQGTCAVHHLFGAQVTKTVRQRYSDAFHTAHLEVPGEMFSLAMESQQRGRGVVGSTSDILNFIRTTTLAAVKEETAAAAAATVGGGAAATTGEEGTTAFPQRKQQLLQFVLGTEAGMITSIVSCVQEVLRAHPNSGVEVEIVFPVSSEAVAVGGDTAGGLNSPLGVVPGPAAGEGCSAAGGCATCPFMKMNTLDALFDLAGALPDDEPALSPVPPAEGVAATAVAATTTAAGDSDADFLSRLTPRQYSDVVRGRPVTELGVVPIRHMRELMETGSLSDELVHEIVGGGDGGTEEAAN